MNMEEQILEDYIKVELGFEARCEDVFNAMKDSPHMKSAGYTTSFSKKYERDSAIRTIDGVEFDMPIKGALQAYTLQFKIIDKSMYIHIRGLDEEVISEFTYLVGAGDEEAIVKDIAALVNELRKDHK